MHALLGCCAGGERGAASPEAAGARSRGAGGRRAAAAAGEEARGAARAKLMELWGSLVLHRRACDAQDMPTRYEELASLLGSYDDLHPEACRRKRISSQGAVCLARVRWRETEYTGLFEGSDNCLLRLSSALPTNLSDPTAPIMPNALGSLQDTVLVPFVALKVFRACFGSGNLVFGGRKTGQSEPDYFKHCLSTHLTERTSAALWPVMRVFRRHSQYPMQMGLSDFAAVGQDPLPSC
ncbi:unnamed protein product [Prorocentrum cordatum]|uniref:Poly(ADP-ribose) glycohydrolase n=1 Tax=Prorocentrum cordatum TaxID=2364126 RepID=A0ABN9UAV1_9DINO|nr:unnamed protein product [Polarella glacialis]